MLASAVLAVVSLATSPADAQRLWVDQQESFGHVAAFRVRAAVHADERAVPPTLKSDVEQQIATTLREQGIRLTDLVPHASPNGDATADLIIDIHVADGRGSTAIAWSLHVSQFVRLSTGEWAFAGTWIVGDLIVRPKDAAARGMRDSLQPALNEFCAAHLSSRERRIRNVPSSDGGAQL